MRWPESGQTEGDRATFEQRKNQKEKQRDDLFSLYCSASAALNRCDECYVVFSIIYRGGEQQKDRTRTRSNDIINTPSNLFLCTE